MGISASSSTFCCLSFLTSVLFSNAQEFPLHRNHIDSNGVLRRLDERPLPLHDLRIIFSLDIEVGTPSKTFAVIPDTGSDVLWIPNSNCTGCPRIWNRYDPKASSTEKFLPDNITHHTKYGDQTEVDGPMLTDRVCLADDICVDEQALMAITSTILNQFSLSNHQKAYKNNISIQKIDYTNPKTRGQDEAVQGIMGLMPGQVFVFCFLKISIGSINSI